MKDNKDVKKFISNIADNNYSEANKTLQQMIENKLKQRIKTALAEKN